MNEQRSKVLVTGGAGYIGSHVCKALARAGYNPIAYDNLIYGHEWAVKWGPFEFGDILDRARLDDVMRRYKPEAVMHFAAFAYVGKSVSDPGKYYRNNVMGSLTLLEAVRDHGITHFVFSSTAATYGVPQTLLIHEDSQQEPINPYGASKLFVERMLKDFGSAHGVRSIALRYFNAAGADPDNETGESHDPETHLISRSGCGFRAKAPCHDLWGRLRYARRNLHSRLYSCLGFGGRACESASGLGRRRALCGI